MGAIDRSEAWDREQDALDPLRDYREAFHIPRAPAGGGTQVKMTETGFRQMGWEAAVLEQQYAEHVAGWDHFLPRVAPYVASLEVRS